MVNKDIVHQKMRRRIEKPRIILLDCPLEYKKGESQTNIEITKETDFAWVWTSFLLGLEIKCPGSQIASSKATCCVKKQQIIFID